MKRFNPLHHLLELLEGGFVPCSTLFIIKVGVPIQVWYEGQWFKIQILIGI